MRVAQVLTLAAVAVSAQTTVQEYDSSLDMEINAGAVDTSIKCTCPSQHHKIRAVSSFDRMETNG